VAVPIDALPDDPEALRALVIRLATERDAALAESQRVSEQNDRLRHLLRQLQRNSSAAARSGSMPTSSSPRRRHRDRQDPPRDRHRPQLHPRRGPCPLLQRRRSRQSARG
jgi:hypothetical protein